MCVSMSALAPAKARACGKVILLGEHFVVPHADGAEAPALAFPLAELACEVKIAPSSAAGKSAFCAENAPDHTRSAIEEKMARALAAAGAALRVDVASLEVRSRASLPLSRGFGSSAAFSVALVRALDAFAGHAPAARDSRDWYAATHAVEAVFHGAPSGLDTAVILAERPIRFHRGKTERFVATDDVELLAIDSGPREAAALLIARVRELRAEHPSTWARFAARVTTLVDECERALAHGYPSDVGKILEEGHAILAELGLSTPRIEALLADAKKCGALGGKVSGAGAGGAVVVATRSGDGPRVAQALTKRGHTVMRVSASNAS